MASCKMTTHVVQPGDTFYRLAQRYKTTVPEIIMRNPGINPYNLQEGTRLVICSGAEQDNGMQEMDVSNDMRHAWVQHVFWDMITQNAIVFDSPNREAAKMRLMQTPEEIAAVFAGFYPQQTVDTIDRLLHEHIRIGGMLTENLKEGNEEQTTALEEAWRQNAEAVARELSDINSEYRYDELLRHFLMHLDLAKRQVKAQLAGEYEEAIRLFDENENHVMELADHLTAGLLKKFYRPVMQ